MIKYYRFIALKMVMKMTKDGDSIASLENKIFEAHLPHLGYISESILEKSSNYVQEISKEEFEKVFNQTKEELQGI